MSAANQGRGVKLLQVSPSAKGTGGTHYARERDTGIDIIAIHGLDTNSPHTWEFKKEDGQKVNWLADQHMLPAEVPGTRIFTCDWPAELLETKDSVSLRIEELALSLLQGILGSNPERNRPILFIASCLGGIILMQALVEAKDEYACIREATRGVIFLATPFRGTSFQEVAIWARPGLRIRASIRGKRVSKLLGYLTAPTFELARLVGKFTRLCKGRDHEGFEVFTFYETGYTYLAAQASFLSFLLPGSKKPLVDMSSATLDCVPNPLPLHRNHSRMNKFCGPLDSDPDYKSVVEVIQRSLRTIVAKSPLEQADAWIREKHYDKQRLKIERLSGDSLDMSQCYINLALVEIQEGDSSEAMFGGPSPFSWPERLKLETPDDDLRVELPDLFQSRKMADGNTKAPRRILIRGHAGVGKTTLCKKIVYDFIHGEMWQDLFKRVVWIRLRELKSLPNDNYNLDSVLRNSFFRQGNQHAFLSDQICNKLCTELWRHIEDTQSRDTLFLLDGLDEVPELTMEYKHRNPHPGHEFLRGLLNRPNVIITTRPHATFPSDFQQLDLELDTMGFSQDQVQAYIEAVMPDDKDIIRSYLEKHDIMQSLVQTPVQLDALCFTWQASSTWNTVIPETMTAVYEAMVKELWRKDNERLEKDGIQIIGNASPAETDPFDSSQYENLGYLAFSGLYSNVIEFQPHHRNTLYSFMEKGKTSLSFDETFARLSFWRTSDPSNRLTNQSYHFIHLTFQEYFSAQHFARAWRYEQDLKFVEFDGERSKTQVVSCRQFLEEHKYLAQYSIMWSFVTGLLDEDEAQTCRFFEALEHEPVDMLGPAQQRLLIYCLAEVTQSVEIRTRLEDDLSQWVEFELNFRGTSNLILDAKFPERAMNLVLERTSEENKMAILQPFRSGHFLPLATTNLVTGWLERRVLSEALQIMVLRVLLRRAPSLPIRTLNAIVVLMDDDDKETRDLSVVTLSCEAPWPDAILSAVMARFESQDSDTDSGIKQRTARALCDQLTHSTTLLHRIASWLKDRVPSTTEAVLETLEHQHKLDEDIVRIMATMLEEDQQQDIRLLAFKILQQRNDLPHDVVEVMLAYLEDDDFSAVWFSTRGYLESLLSDNMLRALKTRLESQDMNVQQKALKVLCRERKRWPRMLVHDFFDILVRLLEAGDNENIQSALNLLSNDSGLPEKITKAVAIQLENHDQDISYLAYEVLISQKISCASVINKTIKWLKSEDQERKRTILRFLGRNYLSTPGVLRVIVEQFDDQDENIRQEALHTLSRLGSWEVFPNDMLSAITKQIFHADKSTGRAAAKTLARIWDRQGSPSELLKDIVADLKSNATRIRKAASESLAVIGFKHSFPDSTFDAVVLHLADVEGVIRYTAARTLEKLAHRQIFPDHVLQPIAALLEDPYSKIRFASMMTLRTLAYEQPFPDHCLQPIASLLKNTDEDVRLDAVETLRRLATQQSFPHDILEAITGLLGDHLGEIRCTAFGALKDQSRLPEDTAQAMVVSALSSNFFEDRLLEYVEERVLEKWNGEMKCQALLLTRRLPKLSDEIHRLVLAMLGHEFDEVRRVAVEVIASRGDLSDGMSRQLPKFSDEIHRYMLLMLRDESEQVKRVALKALASGGDLSDTRYSDIERLLKSDNRWIRLSAMRALGTDPTLSDEILQGVIRWVNDSDEEVRVAAVEALKAQHKLPDTIFKSTAFYSVWLEKSFRESVLCLTQYEVTYMTLPGGFGWRPLSGQPNELREAIRKRQTELGMPMTSKEIYRP